jgi:uncharacterized protein YwqG
MFRWLFGSKQAKPAMQADITRLAANYARPALQMIQTDVPSRSHFGGSPTVKSFPEQPPLWKGKPLPLVAQIDLEDLQALCSTLWLPTTGTILFYYDWIEQPTWGFSPEDRGSWLVHYTAERAQPALFVPVKNKKREPQTMSVAMRRINTIPSQERPQIASLNHEDDDFVQWSELSFSVYGNLPQHQLLGFPQNVQSDSMELECQLVSHGLYCGDPSGYNDPRAKILEPGAADWELLLQIDSDEELQVMFGDVGKLYFWIRRQDAQSGNFQNAWMISQCH